MKYGNALRGMLVLLLLQQTAELHADAAPMVTTLNDIPGKTCQVAGPLPGVVHREIRQQLAGNPVTVAVAEAVSGMKDLATKQGANTVLGMQISMIPLDRGRGKEFGDVILIGTFANCE